MTAAAFEHMLGGSYFFFLAFFFFIELPPFV